MIKVAPSILSADFSKLGEEVLAIEHAGADWIHIDVMDGHYVPNLTIGPPVIRAIRPMTKLPFDVHLMIENAESCWEKYYEAGADIITVHAEACVHIHRVLQAIRAKGIKAGVSVNPGTPLCMIEPVLGDVDVVLLMSVNPGFGGQKYIPYVTEKIAELRAMCDKKGFHNVEIEVDGGVDSVTVIQVVGAGATVLVAGSAVFGAPDREAMISLLKRA